MIELRSLSKSFDHGSTWAVREVSLVAERGQTVVLLGSSGCGKTTTLKMINRLIEPTAGQTLINGTDVREQNVLRLRRSVGYVFQDIGLFPHMTVAENVVIIPKLLGWDRARRHTRTRQLLDLVGLDPDTFAGRLPAHLSGGQQQRVGLARALAPDPDHLLMDEPFGALDAVTRDQLQTELIRISDTLHKTIIFVTHDIFEAMRLGDMIGVMNHGHLEQFGTTHEVADNPATPFVKALMDQARHQAETLQQEETT